MVIESPERVRNDKPLPPLQNGDLLSREEFEARPECHPEIKRAELLEGDLAGAIGALHKP